MAYNPFGNSTGVEDFRKPFGSDTGVENFSNDISEEERKRKLALLTDLYNGGNIGDMASKLIGERIAPIQEAITNPQDALRQRFGMPVEQVQPTGGPVAPMPDETSAETQRLLQQNQQAQGVPVAPTMQGQPPVAEGQPPISVDLSPEAQQDIQKRAQALEAQQAQQNQPTPTAPVNPNEVVQQVNQTVLPQAGAGVQVAGPTVTPPAPVPQWSQDLNNAQGDVTKLHAIAGNANYPEDVRKLAGELTAKQYKGQIEENKANETIAKAFSGQDPKAMNQVMSDLRKERTEGSYLKAILYQRLGLGELAKEEQQKLGAGVKIGQSMIDGKQYTVEYDGQGAVKRAWNAEGARMEDKELAKISAGGMKPGTHAFGFTGERAIVPQGQKGAGEEVVPYTNYITRDVGYVYATGPFKGETYTGSTPQAKRVDTNSAIALNDAMIKFQTAPTTAMATEMLKLAGQTDTGDGKTIANTMNRIQQLSPAIFNQIKGSMPAPTVQAQPSNVSQAQPSNVPQAQPSGPVNPAQVQPQVQPVQGGGSLTSQKAGQEANVDINKQQVIDRNKSNQTYSDSLAASRQTAAAQSSTINRLQTAIDRNPNFWGIDTNSSAWRAFVDVNSTNPQKAESLDTLARNMNIPKEQRTAFDSVMNDYRNLQVNAITGSGLTASQTNTERESQRVMGTIGSISDRPAAAKATLEYAKAKIEYTDAKAKDWAQARKTNPGIDRLDFESNFDATKGEQIFQKANERMNKILGGPAETPKVSEGQTSVSKTGKPIVYRNNRWEYQ